MSYEFMLEARCDALAFICVHTGEEANEYRALATPIVLASAFSFDDTEHARAAFRGDNDAYIYGRWGNPTVEALERKVAALERARAACATASGMAAVSGALLSICDSGAHVVAPRSMYGESARLLRERLPKLGIETTFIDDPSPEAYARAVKPSTRIFYIESPSNPTLAVADIPGIVSGARERGIVTIADNTFATPFCQNPLDHGVDLVVHSMTKSLGGHGDAIGGVIAGSEERVARARDTVVKGFGGVMAPLTAYLVARGMVRSRSARGRPAPRQPDSLSGSRRIPRSNVSTTPRSCPRKQCAPSTRTGLSSRSRRTGRAPRGACSRASSSSRTR